MKEGKVPAGGAELIRKTKRTMFSLKLDINNEKWMKRRVVIIVAKAVKSNQYTVVSISSSGAGCGDMVGVVALEPEAMASS